MPILNKPGSLTKGVKYTFTLSKSDILSLPKVSSNTYFSNPANWKTVALMYRSSTGNQHEAVTFHMDENAEPLPAVFHVSTKSRSQFNILQLTIHDFDGGYLKIVRDELVPSEFDITLPEEAGDTFFAYISNFNADAVVVGSLIGADPLTDIGQSFTISSPETLRSVNVKIKNNVAETALLTMKVYKLSDRSLVATSSTVDASTVGSSFTETAFNFNDSIPVGNYYYRITVSEALNGNLDFAGKASNSEIGGNLYASGTEWNGHDMDFKLFTDYIA